MLITQTPLLGAYLLEPQPAFDDRGFFARVWCASELAEKGLNAGWVQSSISMNESAHTLRGLHYQAAPHEEVKLVRCTSGAVFDVVVDVRADSSTYMEWFSVELNTSNNLTLYVPPGLAHGFMTLEDRSVVEYHMSEFHEPGAARCVRWDDPAFGIEWPFAPVTISERDRTCADFEGAR